MKYKVRILSVIGILIFCAVIIAPPLIHGYIYPNVGDDSAAHLEEIENVINGDANGGSRYVGFLMIAYPIMWLNQLFGWSINSVYLWASYATLIIVGLVIYCLFSQLFNRVVGGLAVLIVLFCSQSLLFLFYYGIMYNLINMGIILPLLLYFAVKYSTEQRIKYLVPMVVLVALFSSFHTTGIYLSAFTGVAISIYMVYNWIRKFTIDWRLVSVGLGAIILNLACLVLFVPDIMSIAYTYSANIKNSQVLGIPFTNYVYSILSVIILILLVALTPMVINRMRLKVGLESKYKVAMVLLLSSALCLLFVVVFKLAHDTWRQALDLSTLLALLASVFVGIIIVKVKHKLLPIGLGIIVSVGLIYNLPTWFDYNSAISDADKEAIEYVNTLDYEYYNGSNTIASWVYDRFIDKEFSDRKETGLLIVRNKPMTPRSTVDNYWYIPPHTEYVPDDSYTMTREFYDGDVKIKVYEK